VNVHHLHIRLPHVGFGSFTNKTLTLITFVYGIQIRHTLVYWNPFQLLTRNI
jgi:hypothetical protein